MCFVSHFRAHFPAAVGLFHFDLVFGLFSLRIRRVVRGIDELLPLPPASCLLRAVTSTIPFLGLLFFLPDGWLSLLLLVLPTWRHRLQQQHTMAMAMATATTCPDVTRHALVFGRMCATFAPATPIAPVASPS